MTTTHPLWTNYIHWLRSRLILDACIAASGDGLSVGTVEAALENAVMRRLLDAGARPEVSSLLALDHQSVERGLREVGVQGSEALAKRWMGAIDEVRTTRMEPTALSPRIERDRLICGALSARITAPVARLIRYARERSSEREALTRVAICVLRYASIFSRTRHIGPPQDVYDLFYDWGVRNEGFASPFNARVLGKPDAAFYSAFADTDGFFGSQGSFFALEEPTHPGAWSIDPPFLKETLDRACATITRWKERGCTPPILFICPASYEIPLSVDETVILERGVHSYEGMNGETALLPVDVAIHRIGELPGFDAEAVRQGYLVS